MTLALVITAILALAFLICWFCALGNIVKKDAKIKELQEKLNEALDIIIGEKKPTCEQLGHEYVAVKLKPNNQLFYRYADEVWYQRDNLRNSYTAPGLILISSKGSGLANCEAKVQVDEVILKMCAKCKKVFPLNEAELQMLPEWSKEHMEKEDN